VIFHRANNNKFPLPAERLEDDSRADERAEAARDNRRSLVFNASEIGTRFSAKCRRTQKSEIDATSKLRALPKQINQARRLRPRAKAEIKRYRNRVQELS